MPQRKLASVFPEPVGAQISVLEPREIASQPPAWAGVGPSKEDSNQRLTGALNGASGSFPLKRSLLALERAFSALDLLRFALDLSRFALDLSRFALGRSLLALDLLCFVRCFRSVLNPPILRGATPQICRRHLKANSAVVDSAVVELRGCYSANSTDAGGSEESGSPNSARGTIPASPPDPPDEVATRQALASRFLGQEPSRVAELAGAVGIDPGEPPDPADAPRAPVGG